MSENVMAKVKMSENAPKDVKMSENSLETDILGTYIIGIF